MTKEWYTERTVETSVSIVNSKVEAVRNKDITKTGLRVYENGKIGVAGAIGDFDEGELLAQANSALAQGIEYPYELSQNRKEEHIFEEEIIKNDELVNEVEELISVLKKDQPEFIYSGKVSLSSSEVKLKNEKGLDLHFKDKCIVPEIDFKEKSSANIFDGFVVSMGRKYDRQEFVKMCNNTLGAFENKVDLPSDKKLPVIFIASDTLLQLKFIKDLNGQLMGTKASIFTDKIGKKAFNDNFTLYQASSIEDVVMQPFFDAEGIINDGYRYNFIENGIIKAPYTDKKTAQKYGLPLTGSSMCEYDGVPSIGLASTLGESRLKIQESDKTIKELLGGQMGIFVALAGGGDFTPNGEFGTPVQVAFLFDGERFVGKFPELKISSNIFDMFGSGFRGVSKDSISPLWDEKYIVMDVEVSKMY